jgi:hypothetical protein
MKKLFAIIGLCFASTAFAANGGDINGAGCTNNCGNGGGAGGQGGNGGNGGNGGQGGNANNANIISNTNVATGGTGVGLGVGIGRSTSTSDASAAASATQSQTATASNSGNAQSVVINEAQQVRQAPAASAPTVYNTANCRVGFSGGLSTPVGGLSFGGSDVDETCELIELSKRLSQLGLRDEAVQLMCLNPKAKKVMGPLCIAE